MRGESVSDAYSTPGRACASGHGEVEKVWPATIESLLIPGEESHGATGCT